MTTTNLIDIISRILDTLLLYSSGLWTLFCTVVQACFVMQTYCPKTRYHCRSTSLYIVSNYVNLNQIMSFQNQYHHLILVTNVIKCVLYVNQKKIVMKQNKDFSYKQFLSQGYCILCIYNLIYTSKLGQLKYRQKYCHLVKFFSTFVVYKFRRPIKH